MGTKRMNKEEIKEFILESGSDNLGVFAGRYEGGIQLQQIPEEITDVIHYLQDKVECTNFLEIGTAGGGTTFVIDHFFKPEKIILVDDNQHGKSAGRGEVLKDVTRKEVIGNSQLDDTIALVAKQGLEYEIMIIDADHSYAGVKKDTESYTPFLKSGGYVIYHDTFSFPNGVGRLVTELTAGNDLDLVHAITVGERIGLSIFRKN